MTILDRHGRPYLCDWWMPTRSKCDEPATVDAQDRYGAPLRFCRKHWPLISDPAYSPLMYSQPVVKAPGPAAHEASARAHGHASCRCDFCQEVRFESRS